MPQTQPKPEPVRLTRNDAFDLYKAMSSLIELRDSESISFNGALETSEGCNFHVVVGISDEGDFEAYAELISG